MANHELAITFDDGQMRKFSMLPYLHYPAFAALKDPELFNQARVALAMQIEMERRSQLENAHRERSHTEQTMP